MSVYMNLLFSLLIVEMFAVTILVLPLPYQIRKKLFQVYEALARNQQLRVVIGISYLLIGLLFVDSLQKIAKLKTNNTYNPANYTSTYTQNYDNVARIFYNQRNLYISGAIWFLGMAGVTTFTIIRRLIKYTEFIKNEKSAEASSKLIDELKAELKRKTIDVETLKSQKNNLGKSYDELSSQLNKEPTDKKHD